MSILQVSVGAPAKQGDNTQPNALGGALGELATSRLHGDYYNLTSRGMVYSGNQGAAGAVIPIYSNTTQQCGILNPGTSGVNIVPIRINFGYVDTTGAAGSFALGYITTGDGIIATGGKGVTAATLSTPVPCKLGSTPAKGLFMASAITTVAPGLLMQLGLNQLVTTATDATTTPWVQSYDFNGSVVVPPGTGIFAAGNIAVLIKMAISIIWAEVPIV